jgi:hypothetical protein
MLELLTNQMIHLLHAINATKNLTEHTPTYSTTQNILIIDIPFEI